LLNEYADPMVKYNLGSAGEKEITDKGCVPPLQLLQDKFSLHLENLPPEAFHKCVTVVVHSGDEWAALTFINPGSL
jgi:hypothetical protein